MSPARMYSLARRTMCLKLSLVMFDLVPELRLKSCAADILGSAPAAPAACLAAQGALGLLQFTGRRILEYQVGRCRLSGRNR